MGFEAVTKQQLGQIFPFEVSHDFFLQEEENMAPLVAYASEDIGNISYTTMGLLISQMPLNLQKPS